MLKENQCAFGEVGRDLTCGHRREGEGGKRKSETGGGKRGRQGKECTGFVT